MPAASSTKQEYTIKLTCETSCAVLVSVERRSHAESGWANQVGEFVDVAGNPRIRKFLGIQPYNSVVNEQEFMASDYSIRWKAPAQLTYETLYVRVTYVMDD
eukprot:9492017-Pyramimonas_sp.AAC.2